MMLLHKTVHARVASWPLEHNQPHLLRTEMALSSHAAFTKARYDSLEPLRHALAMLIEQLTMHIVHHKGGHVDNAGAPPQSP